jgi:branched-chain amino acid transport system substrate-binding protein
MAGAQQLTAIQQVRRAGFNGIQLGGSSIENSLSNVGEAGEGIIWVSNFSYLSSNKTSAAFTKLYEGIFNERPLVYAAEGYDSVWWIARGLKEAGKATREALKDGLTAVGKAGFEGAQGPITFVDNDARTGGILIQWKGGQQAVLAESN